LTTAASKNNFVIKLISYTPEFQLDIFESESVLNIPFQKVSFWPVCQLHFYYLRKLRRAWFRNPACENLVDLL